MRYLIFLTFLLLFVLLSFSSCDPSCHTRCENGVLYRASCVNGECISGGSSYCPTGRCADEYSCGSYEEEKTPECQTDADCPPMTYFGHTYQGYCEDGTCQYYDKESTEEEYQEKTEVSDACKDVYCPETLCYKGYYYTGGFCDPKKGKCFYKKMIKCSYGCDEETGICKSKPDVSKEPTFLPAPKMEVSFSKTTAFLTGDDYIDIEITLTRNNTGVRGANVYILFEDPKEIGLIKKSLGKMGIKRYSNNQGKVKGRISFPSITAVSRLYWDDFPYTIPVTVQASMHNYENDWSIRKTFSIKLYSPVPKIESFKVSPDPAKDYGENKITLIFDDPDNTGPWKFRVERLGPGGAWINYRTSDSIAEGVTDKKRVVLKWSGPKYGYSQDELSIARTFYKETKGKAKDKVMGVVLNKTKTYLTNKEEEVGKPLLQNTFRYLKKSVDFGSGIYNGYKSLNNMLKNMKEIHDAVSTKDKVYRSLDLTLEYVKFTVNFFDTISSPAKPKAVSKIKDTLLNAIGYVQSSLKLLSAKEKSLYATTYKTPFVFEVTVEDKDGYVSKKLMFIDVEYVFKPPSQEKRGETSVVEK